MVAHARPHMKDLFGYEPPARHNAPQPAAAQPATVTEAARRFAAWRAADEDVREAEGRWHALDQRDEDTRDASENLHNANTLCSILLQELVDAPLTCAADAVAVLAALVFEMDTFGEMSEQLNIAPRNLPRRLAQFLPNH